MRLDGGTVTLGNDLDFAGDFAATLGTLNLNGHTLTLHNTPSLMTAYVDGPGTLKVAGSATIGSNFGVRYTDPAATLEDAGSIEQTGNVLWNGTVQIDSGKSYSITTASALHNVGGTYMAIVNDGTFTDTAAGTSTVDASFANNGTLTIGSGATLHLNSGTSSLGGSITGAGTLQFGVGTATIATTTVSVAEMDIVAGTTVLGNDLSYAGTFNTTNGGAQLDLNGHTLTLSGPASLMSTLVTGPGTRSRRCGDDRLNFGVRYTDPAATLEDAGQHRADRQRAVERHGAGR